MNFFIYLYRDETKLEEEIEEKIAKKLRKDIRCPKQLIPIAINRYQKNRKEFYGEKTIDEIESEYKRIDNIQAGSNSSKKPIKKKPVKKKPSKKKPLTTEQRSRNAKNYWRTSRKLQNRMTDATRKKYDLPSKGKKPKKGTRSRR